MNAAAQSTQRSRVSNTRPSATSRPSSEAASPPSAASNAWRTCTPVSKTSKPNKAELANDGTDNAAHAPTATDLATTATQLESVIANGEPEQAKALLRTLIAELRVNGRHHARPRRHGRGLRNVSKSGRCGAKAKPSGAGGGFAASHRGCPRWFRPSQARIAASLTGCRFAAHDGRDG
jgi:hypothetical protein